MGVDVHKPLRHCMIYNIAPKQRLNCILSLERVWSSAHNKWKQAKKNVKVVISAAMLEGKKREDIMQ